MSPLVILTALMAAISGATAAVAAPVTAVPPAEYRPAALPKSQPALLLGANAPAMRITLPEPTAANRMLAKANTVAPISGKGRPLQIGFGRDIPAAMRTLDLGALQWQLAPDGGRAARIEIESIGAMALRVALAMSATHPDLGVRLVGNGQKAEVQGPYAANAIAEATAKFGTWWSPVLEGSRATIELSAGPGVAVKGVKLTLVQVSHLALAGDALRPGALVAKDIGDSGSCNVNVKCVSPQSQPFVDQSNATGKIVFMQENGNSYACTGTLLNDSITSFTPLFFTADHCINSALAAATLNVYWFFESVACGSPTTPGPYALQTSGAKLLGRSLAEDWALVRLNAAPPAGTYFSAWRAETIPTNALVSTFHHPQGDLKKWSQGSVQGYELFEIGDDDDRAAINDVMAAVQWSDGTTEGGSSGSGLLTFLSSGGYYEVRGGLAGGSASCGFTSGTDYFSRMDKMIPLVRQYLTPDAANPTGLVVVVEYYNPSLNHFFITSSAAEINDLDTGVHAGWERTGLRFLAYSNQAAGTNPVCRFYRAPGFGDSHFYSASPSECTAVLNNPGAFPGWVYEAPNVFYIQLPNTTTGACPAGTHPLWRFFSTLTTNHRYTADVSIRDNLRVTPGLIPEGYGPDAVIMCSPNGN